MKKFKEIYRKLNLTNRVFFGLVIILIIGILVGITFSILIFVATHFVCDGGIRRIWGMIKKDEFLRWIQRTIRKSKFLQSKFLQWTWKVIKKSNFLLLHCFIYTIGFIPAFLFFRISFWWLFLIFSSHFLIDKRFSPEETIHPVRSFLSEKFRIKISKPSFRDDFLYCILVLFDQGLHITILFIISCFTYNYYTSFCSIFF